MVRRFWVSFDLGLQGNYDSFYKWLDRQDYKDLGDRLGAKECGDNVATFVSDGSREMIAKQIKTILGPGRKARVYIITLKEGGRFFLGGRKLPPWKGYAEVEDSGEET